jgi:hypothetical protein
MSSRKYDRRSVLAYSATGGVAFVGALGTMFGPTTGIVFAGQAAATAPPVPAGRMRRIVTGHKADGKSYIVSDEMADVANLWTTQPDQPLGLAPAGEPRQLSRVTGQTRFFKTTIQPSKDPKPNLENRIGFHRTPGIAYCFMLTGEIVFLVDTQEVRVRAGDLVVERNTMHSWRNEGTVPVDMLITVVNASA